MKDCRFVPMMNGNMSAAHAAGEGSSCAYFQASQADSMILFMDTIFVVSFFLSAGLCLASAVLVRITITVLICLAILVSYNFIRAKEQP